MLAPDGQRFAYGDLVSVTLLHSEAQPQSRLRSPDTFKVMGKSVPRVDIPAKLTGGAAFVQDLRLPKMVHGRVVRPPSYGASLRQIDWTQLGSATGTADRLPDTRIGVVGEPAAGHAQRLANGGPCRRRLLRNSLECPAAAG